MLDIIDGFLSGLAHDFRVLMLELFVSQLAIRTIFVEISRKHSYAYTRLSKE
jgi:hypothetical protein